MDSDPAHLSTLFLLFQQVSELPLYLAAQLFVLLALLLASALFSGSEVALFSLDPTAKHALAQSGDRASTRVLALLEHPRQLLVTILMLNTVVNVGAAIVAAIMITDVAQRLNWSPEWTLLLEMVLLTFILLVVSEITPKLIASRHAPAFSRRVSAPLLAAYRTLAPVARALSQAMSAMQRRIKTTSVQRISTEDLKTMAEIGEAHGTLEEEERDLIHSIVEFGETTVREVMVSRLDIVALPVTATLDEALEVIRTSGHSRMPLYAEHLDNILGIVYAKDLLPYLSDRNGPRNVDWTRIARPPMFIPLGKKLDDLLRDMQAKKMHLAIVVDEYGGTAGLITMEDVLEEIVGDIRDEHDEAEPELYTRLDVDRYRFDARIDLDELNEILDLDLDTEAFDFETLGGLIFHVTGAIPSEGDEIRYGALRLRVESVENHRIGQVLVEIDHSVEAGDQPVRREE